MQEPQASKLPAAYDDKTTLFGAMVNHKTFTVKYMVDVETLQVVVNEDASMMEAPLYITYQGGEIWFVGAGGITQNDENEWLFELESHFDQRAMHGSPLQPHAVGEKIYVGLLSQNIVMAKRVLQAAQKYRFLVGTNLQRTAITPEVGERFLCTDTQKIYYCLLNGVWTWMGLQITITRSTHSLQTCKDGTGHWVTSSAGMTTTIHPRMKALPLNEFAHPRMRQWAHL